MCINTFVVIFILKDNKRKTDGVSMLSHSDMQKYNETGIDVWSNLSRNVWTSGLLYSN